MTHLIRELRDLTGLTQKAFAAAYGIPLSTLRKWEQGEASPAPYILNLIARTLPGLDKTLITIKTDDGVFYYDPNKKTVSDSLGNTIRIQEDLTEINKGNLALYLQDLFTDFYEIQEKFNRDCRYDREEGILWSR